MKHLKNLKSLAASSLTDLHYAFINASEASEDYLKQKLNMKLKNVLWFQLKPLLSLCNPVARAAQRVPCREATTMRASCASKRAIIILI